MGKKILIIFRITLGILLATIGGIFMLGLIIQSCNKPPMDKGSFLRVAGGGGVVLLCFAVGVALMKGQLFGNKSYDKEDQGSDSVSQ